MMAERNPSLWDLEEESHFLNGKILITPEQCHCKKEEVKFNMALKRPCVVEATINWTGSSQSQLNPKDIEMSLFQEGDYKGFGIKLIHTKQKKLNCLMLSTFCGDEQNILKQRVYLVSNKIHYKIEANEDNVKIYC